MRVIYREKSVLLLVRLSQSPPHATHDNIRVAVSALFSHTKTRTCLVYTTLEGSIPDELGQLKSLSFAWLYGNEFSGE